MQIDEQNFQDLMAIFRKYFDKCPRTEDSGPLDRRHGPARSTNPPPPRTLPYGDQEFKFDAPDNGLTQRLRTQPFKLLLEITMPDASSLRNKIH